MNEEKTDQGELINEGGWDTLIILDACRFDFFKDTYKEYLDGSLQKTESRGSETVEWLKNTFTGNYDLTYISANPIINSLGVESCDFNPTYHFKKIVDVWDFGWDDDAGVVRPEAVNEAYHENKDKRVILHYMQPHRPFLKSDLNAEMGNRKRVLSKKESGNHFLKSMRSKMGAFWDYRKIFWKLRSYLNIPPTSGWEHLWRRGNSENHIRHLYMENLKIALSSVKEILKPLDGKTVVTSDHGEAFGEHNEWGHRTGVRIPSLIRVPWLEVENNGKRRD